VRLREAVWDPIERHLDGVGLVFIVPDGALNLVSFPTLPSSNGGYLLEGERLFHLLSAERDLVPEPEPPSPVKGLLLVGGPDYEKSPAEPCETAGVDTRVVGVLEGRRQVRRTQDDAPSLRTQDPMRGGPGGGRGEGSRAFRSVKFAPIPRAVEEVREIKELWEKRFGSSDPSECVVLSRKAACEDAFKTLAPRYRFIHLATHGIFHDADPPAAANDGAGKSAAKAPPGAKGGTWGFIGSDHPLLLSGLALAGANRRDEAAPDQEDGIITADEIASLDLNRVDWAVLSGCETGAGIFVPGEGIFGLRRAFQVAGARTLIMSLWRVKDDDARHWMTMLYGSRLDHQSVPRSMRNASLAILEARRRQGSTTHPFYWGAWVSAGSWR
jgi:hypothetical protein